MAHWVFDWFDRDIQPIIGDLETQTIPRPTSVHSTSWLTQHDPEFVSGIIDFR